MDLSEDLVLFFGLALIAAIGWYFLGPRKAVAAHAGASGAQVVNIRVKGGYTPDRVVVARGRPVRLNFFRDETDPCSEQVIFGDFGLVRDLPAHQTTTVELTVEEPGEYGFACGMNMLHGKLIVE